MILFTVLGNEGQELARVETASTDDFYNFRDKVHSSLEDGEFGSKFPIFMHQFEPAEWSADEVAPLLHELRTIAAAFKTFPPEPNLASAQMWDEIKQGRYSTLHDVYRDAADKPLLDQLIALCERALKEARPIQME